MRESTLASILPDLTKEQINKAIKRNNTRFTPKYRAFSILQNKIEEVVQRTTRSWKNLYNKIEDVFEEEYKEEAFAKIEETTKRKEEKKEVEKKVEEDEKKMEEEKEEEEIQKEDELEQNVQDTQLPPPSPPHSTDTPTKTIKINDVVDTSSQKSIH